MKIVLNGMAVCMAAWLAFPAWAAESSDVGRQAAIYPEMLRALHSLEDSQMELQKGGTHFNGHRQAALKHVNAAIDEVRAGMSFARDHGQAQTNSKAAAEIKSQPAPDKPMDKRADEKTHSDTE